MIGPIAGLIAGAALCGLLELMDLFTPRQKGVR